MDLEMGVIAAGLNHVAHRFTGGKDARAARKQQSAQRRQERLAKQAEKTADAVREFVESNGGNYKSVIYKGDVSSIGEPMQLGINPPFGPGGALKGLKFLKSSRVVSGVKSVARASKISFFKGLGNGIRRHAPSLNRGKGFRIGISKSRGRLVFRATNGG